MPLTYYCFVDVSKRKLLFKFLHNFCALLTNELISKFVKPIGFCSQSVVRNLTHRLFGFSCTRGVIKMIVLAKITTKLYVSVVQKFSFGK